jgi:hypothetical protein
MKERLASVNRLLRGQWRSFQVTETPRGRPFGGGAESSQWRDWRFPKLRNCAIFMGSPQNVFLNALWGSRHVMPLRPPMRHPPSSDNSREGTTTQSQSAGAVWGDRHCSLRNQVLYHLLKTQEFTKACFFIKMPRLSAPRHKAPSRCERVAEP